MMIVHVPEAVKDAESSFGFTLLVLDAVGTPVSTLEPGLNRCRG